MLLDDTFTVARLREELRSGRYDRLHIASHAIFRSYANESVLLADDKVVRLDDLQAWVGAGRSAESGMDLLTLSACDTAEGDERAPLGFAGAAIKAHARSVVAALWPVDDTASRELMRSFYRHLQQDGKADALSAAARDLLSSSNLYHPRYWAPFELIGAWR
jgi:CHAT domain-containing protein